MKGLRFIHPLRGRRLVTVCNLEHGSRRLHLTPDTYGLGGRAISKRSIVVITTRSSRPLHPVSSSSPRWDVHRGLHRRGDLLFSCPLWRCYTPPQWAAGFISDGVAAGARSTSRKAAVLALAAAGGRLRCRRDSPSRRRIRGQCAQYATRGAEHSEQRDVSWELTAAASLAAKRAH